MDQPSSKPAESQTLAEVKPFPARVETEAAAPVPKKPNRKKFVLGGLLLVALAFGGKAGYEYWTVGQYMESTDDAYLQADITAIAPKVQGYVQTVAVKENQSVKAGDLLLQLDDGDYQNAVKTAQSQVATQGETIKRIGTQVGAAKAVVEQARAQKSAAEATLQNAQNKYDRVQRLAKSSVAAQSDVDDATAALALAQAGVTGADAQISAASANVGVLIAQQAEAQSQLESLKLAVDQAQRNLGRTVLRAPVDGVVANIGVREGDLVSPGQKIAAIVPVDAIYISANFKETQLARVAPGAKANVTIDAIDGKTFTGTVASVAPATGAMFSLLPPQNATGNFTKVVQRVPVRITLPKEVLDSGKLRAGLSVNVNVDSRTLPAASGN